MSLTLAVTDIREAIVRPVIGHRQPSDREAAGAALSSWTMPRSPWWPTGSGSGRSCTTSSPTRPSSPRTAARSPPAAVRTRAPLRQPADRAGDPARLVSQDVVWISVTDEGVGIKREDMPKLFQEFSQVDSSASPGPRAPGGAGAVQEVRGDARRHHRGRFGLREGHRLLVPAPGRRAHAAAGLKRADKALPL